ncbi:MAG: GGDEF domain-containing protein [Polyangiaceae bacterium]
MGSFDDDDDDEREDITNVTRNVTKLLQEHDAAQSATEPCLVVLVGQNVGETHRLARGESVVGRSASATIHLVDDAISRKHVKITRQGEEVVLVDLESANGTFVNGDRVARSVLKDGDKVRLGHTTVLKFTYQDKLDEAFQRHMYDAALRDGLTKIFNKKYIDDRLIAEAAYAQRHNGELSLVLIDVDHFKKVNDTFGHPAGDYVLARMAELVSTALRAEDVFGRYGGEEFLVICRGIPLSSAGVVGERLRMIVQSSTFEFAKKVIPLTISVGVASRVFEKLETASQLFVAADGALYEAKGAGRNRVVLHEA